MLESLEKLFEKFRNLGEFPRDLVTWITAFGTIILIFINVKYIYLIIRATRLYLIKQKSACCRVNLQVKYGQWAVVTGATDGIGLAFARELVQRGLSLIIIGRNDEKLARTKTLLESLPGSGEIRTVKNDFSDSSLANYAGMFRNIDMDNLDIGILINNVGAWAPDYERFHCHDEQNLRTTLDVNMTSTVMMTRAFLPKMLMNRRGLIVNVSSVLGCVTCPYFGVYAPTKSFINAFTSQLQFEYRESPIKIVNLTTGPVSTSPFLKNNTYSQDEMSKVCSLWDSAESYARSVINVLGNSPNPPEEFSGLAKHALMNRAQQFANKLGLYARFWERHVKGRTTLTDL